MVSFSLFDPILSVNMMGKATELENHHADAE